MASHFEIFFIDNYPTFFNYNDSFIYVKLFTQCIKMSFVYNFKMEIFKYC